MKKNKYILKMILIVVGLCIIGFISLPFLGLWLITEGIMPSEQDAISIQIEVLDFYSDSKNENTIPDAVKKLNPVWIDVDENGVLIIFKRKFVEDYGYYYCKKGLLPSEDRKIWCKKKIKEGIYYYYNPG